MDALAGTLLAIIEVWSAFMHPHDPWSYILLGTLGAALALLGPGDFRSMHAFLDGSASTFQTATHRNRGIP